MGRPIAETAVLVNHTSFLWKRFQQKLTRRLWHHCCIHPHPCSCFDQHQYCPNPLAVVVGAVAVVVGAAAAVGGSAAGSVIARQKQPVVTTWVHAAGPVRTKDGPALVGECLLEEWLQTAHSQTQRGRRCARR